VKSNLPPPKRLTDKETKVIEWAFNFAHSIVAGDYHLPQPMNFTMNSLQDAVWDLAAKRGISIKDGCSKEYLGVYNGYMEGVLESIRKRVGEDNG